MATICTYLVTEGARVTTFLAIGYFGLRLKTLLTSQRMLVDIGAGCNTAYRTAATLVEHTLVSGRPS